MFGKHRRARSNRRLLCFAVLLMIAVIGVAQYILLSRPSTNNDPKLVDSQTLFAKKPPHLVYDRLFVLEENDNNVAENKKALQRAPVALRDRSESERRIDEPSPFIPPRRIVHLDLKGAPYKPSFYPEIFYTLNQMGASGIVLEWEDMFPYTGKLSKAINKNAYSLQQVKEILISAQKFNLTVTPLVQTFGHLEWVLKLQQFAHLRDDPLYPLVICAANNEAFNLIKEMIDQVLAVHKPFGLQYFHIGADEVFQIGVCNESKEAIKAAHNSREVYMLSHIANVARYVKDRHNLTVLAWHDMLAQAWQNDLVASGLPELVEPVIWCYAEDLNTYLSSTVWDSLRVFPKLWVSSAWKGADGPARYSSNPIHYIRNHESWIQQMNSHQTQTSIQGIVMTGWSRYDHLAILCELWPVALPSLAFSMETILKGKELASFPKSTEVLNCKSLAGPGYVHHCKFPGSQANLLINEYAEMSRNLHDYQKDYDLNGWLSRVADKFAYSSPWYIQKLQPILELHYAPMKKLVNELRNELIKIYYNDTVEEFIFTHMGSDLEWLEQKLKTCAEVMSKTTFQRRPLDLV